MTDPRLKGHALDISTHAPARGATGRWKPGGARNGHFNPRSRTGSDAFVSHIFARGVISTHAPARGATFLDKPISRPATFQPTLPARGATFCTWEDSRLIAISTHAPRTGSDDVNFSFLNASTLISTHAPRTGSDRWIPKSPNMLSKISTHAPRTGSDRCLGRVCSDDTKFQPTLPARGATRYAIEDILRLQISTHAPRTGSDVVDCCPDVRPCVLATPSNFNLRSPHGERPSCRSFL